MSDSGWEDADPFAVPAAKPDPVSGRKQPPLKRPGSASSGGSASGRRDVPPAGRSSGPATLLQTAPTVQVDDGSVDGSPERGSRAEIEIVLGGSKLAFAGGSWRDVSDQQELIDAVHPIIAENIVLRKRVELLVDLVSRADAQNQQMEMDLREADELIPQLEKMLGELRGSQ